MTSNVQAEVRSTMEAVLKLDNTENNIVRSQTPSWDSLKHIELVFTLEDAFELQFDAEVIEQLDSLERISEVIASKQ